MYKSQYNDIYLEIITETWNRFNFDDLVKATALVTNNFKDQWISAKGPGEPTSKKVLAKMNADASKTYGGEYKQGSVMTDQDEVEYNIPGVNTNNPNFYDGSVSWDTKSIVNYWQFRAKNGDQFSSEMAQKLYSKINYENPQPVLPTEIGQLAYGIWKACNSRLNKQETNKQSLTDQGIDLSVNYPIDSKIENLELTLTGFRSFYKQGYNRWQSGHTENLIYGTDEKTGIKFKIKPSVKDKVGEKLIHLFNKKSYGNDAFDLPAEPIKIVVTGKVKMVSPEYKTVSLNYAYLTSPTIEEVNTLQNKLKTEKEAKLEAERIEKQKNINVLLSKGQLTTDKYDEMTEEEQKRFDNNYKKEKNNISEGRVTDNQEILFINGEGKVEGMKFSAIKYIVKYLIENNEFDKTIDELNMEDSWLSLILKRTKKQWKIGLY